MVWPHIYPSVNPYVALWSSEFLPNADMVDLISVERSGHTQVFLGTRLCGKVDPLITIELNADRSSKSFPMEFFTTSPCIPIISSLPVLKCFAWYCCCSDTLTRIVCGLSVPCESFAMCTFSFSYILFFFIFFLYILSGMSRLWIRCTFPQLFQAWHKLFSVW